MLPFAEERLSPGLKPEVCPTRKTPITISLYALLLLGLVWTVWRRLRPVAPAVPVDQDEDEDDTSGSAKV